MAVEDAFEEIARANPDLQGFGTKALTLKLGDQVVSMPMAEFESIGTVVGECLLRGGDFMKEWEPALEYPALLQWAIAEGAYRWAVLRLFRMPPSTAALVLPHVKRFLFFAATLKPLEEGVDHG